MNIGALPLQTLLLDHLSTAVLLLDEQLHLEHINPSAEALLAVSRERALGQPVTQLFYESTDTSQQLLNAATQSSLYTKRHAKWQLLNAGVVTVDYTVTPRGDSPGLIIEIQPIDRLLRISREEVLTSTQETTRNLVRGMAHEIKNPLGGIRGAAQLLTRELPGDELQEYTQVIIDEADRLRHLVDRMLGSHHRPQHQALSVHEVLERVVTIIRAESRDTIRLTRDYDPSIPDLQADKGQLIQAVLNIVRNAMQALEEHTIAAPEIRLITRIQRRHTIGLHHHRLVCRVDIVDNGPGIPDSIAKNIFYPMISGRADGTGLGLTISQHLVHQHQGLIECRSEPGETRFSLYLPMEAPHAET